MLTRVFRLVHPFKRFRCNLSKRHSSNQPNDTFSSPTETTGRNVLQPNAKRIQFSGSFSAEEKEQFLTDMTVFDDFLSVEEEESIIREIEPYMSRMRYEFDHWDDVSSAQ